MRKFVLVAAMVLVSASAQAGGARSLSLAAANDQPSAPQATVAPTATTQMSEVAPAAAPPVYVDRPAAVSTTTPTATTITPASPPAATQPAPKTNAKADRPRHHRTWTEGRIISELHRHGIYW
jgi:hypothetical protein